MNKQLEPVQEEVRNTFDDIAYSYAKLYSDRTRVGHFFNSRKRQVEGMLADAVSGCKVLEVGCGPGLMVDYFLRRGAHYHGVDLSSEMIAGCRERFSGTASAHFSEGDVQQLDFPDSVFDVVLCLGVLEYVPSEPRAVREIARVLKPGGRFILSSINKWSPFNAWDRLVYRRLKGSNPGPIVQEYHTEEYYWQLLPAAGFEITGLSYFDFSLVVHPLDYKLPEISWALSELCEGFRHGMLRGLGNGFLIDCRVV
jgi:ubiquinone/menaquinone biosynthesis C-methylase UbiE